MTTKSYRFRKFRDLLKEPGYLSQLDVARIRLFAKNDTDHEFEEYFSQDKHDALRILSFWEIAQVELWDAEILKRFFHAWIYEDRDMVAARIRVAQRACRLPEHFTPGVALQWLESENVLMGRIPEWIRANARPSAPVVAVGASDGSPDPERRLARLRELGGNAKYSRCDWQFAGIGKLVASEKSEGRNRNDEKTIRADLREAAQAEHDEKRAGFGSGLGQR